MKTKFDGTVSLGSRRHRSFGGLLYGESSDTGYGVNVCSSGLRKVVGELPGDGEVQVRFTKSDPKDPKAQSWPIWIRRFCGEGLCWTHVEGDDPTAIFMGSMEYWLTRLTGIKVADGKRKLYVTAWQWED